MKINIATIDPGLSGGMAFFKVGKDLVLQLTSTRVVETRRGPHNWPNQAVRDQEQKMLQLKPGEKLKDTQSRQTWKDRQEAWNPDVADIAELAHFTQRDERWIVFCEKPAQGQSKFTTAQTIASTAATAALLTAVALKQGHPVISVAPTQWQWLLPDPLDENDTSKTRALRLIDQTLPGVSAGLPKLKKVPHDGIIDALCLGLFVQHHIGEILSKLTEGDELFGPFHGRFQWPLERNCRPPSVGPKANKKKKGEPDHE